MMCRYFVTGFVACAAAGLAQQPQVLSMQTSTGAMGSSGSVHLSAPRAEPVVTGAPYSFQRVQEQVQTLADGTHIKRESTTETMYRDSAGRTRVERSIGPRMEQPNMPKMPTIVDIHDPVSQTAYTLDTVNKVAHRSRLQPLQTPAALAQARGVEGGTLAPVTRLAVPPPPPPPPPQGGGAGGSTGFLGGTAGTFSATTIGPRARPAVKTEQLGQQTIEGVIVEGRRTTQTYEVDTIGNDRPISVVSEMWTSPTLKMTVLSTTDDPRSGKSTTKLVNVSQAEPAADLFQPPGDYQIVDETGDFTIQWGRGAKR